MPPNTSSRCSSGWRRRLAIYRMLISGILSHYPAPPVNTNLMSLSDSAGFVVPSSSSSSNVSAIEMREVVLSLHSKLRDVGAHKAMVVSTAGFQKGALQYASAHGIAAVSFIDGRWTYETKSAQGPADPPPWVKLPRFAGHFMRSEGDRIHVTLVESGEVSALKDWLVSASSSAA